MGWGGEALSEVMAGGPGVLICENDVIVDGVGDWGNTYVHTCGAAARRGRGIRGLVRADRGQTWLLFPIGDEAYALSDVLEMRGLVAGSGSLRVRSVVVPRGTWGPAQGGGGGEQALYAMRCAWRCAAVL